jgi:AraC-like DNA-binding protein
MPDGKSKAAFDAQPFPLAELFDFIEDAVVWVKDHDGRYRWVNRAFLMNYTQAASDTLGNLEQILGKTDYELSPPYLADQFRMDDEQVLAGHRVINRIEQVSQADGTASWNVTNKIPLRNGKREIIGTAGITRPLQAEGQKAPAAPGFETVLNYLSSHYQSAITNRELARLMHMSVRAFERKFLRNFHLTPQKYLRKLRMRLASRSLVYTDHTLVEVALSCGFSDQSHFSREFRRHFGRTPREYREYYAASGTKTGASGQ